MRCVSSYHGNAVTKQSFPLASGLSFNSCSAHKPLPAGGLTGEVLRGEADVQGATWMDMLLNVS